MLTAKNVAILAVVIFCALGMFWVFVLAHSSFHTCINQADNAYTAQYQGDSAHPVASIPLFYGYSTCAARVARHDGDAITAVATAFLALITLGLVLLGLEQSKTAKAQLRAYLTVIIGQATYQDANLRFAGAPEIRNNGQTPAYKVRVWIAADIIAQANIATYDFDRARPANLGDSQASIGPTETRIIEAVVESRVPDADVPGIKEGVNAALWVWGELHYEDAFRDPHCVKFSQRLFWLTNGQVRGQYGQRFVGYS